MIYLILVIILVVVVFGASKQKFSPDKESIKPLELDSYKPTTFMSDNEIEFFNRLIKAFPEYYVFPQVAMSGLVAPKTNDFKKMNSIKNTYNRSRVDFVLYKDKKVFAVIELDDKTHKGKEDKDTKRDGILNQAGYKTFRFNSRNKPSIEQLRKLIGGV